MCFKQLWNDHHANTGLAILEALFVNAQRLFVRMCFYFLESPGNFTGPRTNFKITCQIGKGKKSPAPGREGREIPRSRRGREEKN